MRTRWRSSAICGSARIRISRARGADRHLCAPLSLVGPLALTIEILDRGRRDKQTGEGSMLPHRYYIPALAALAAGLAAVAQAQPPTPAAEQGIASWYGGPFEGQRAASGEIYRPEELTAAHRTLAFGTKVRVRRLDSGQSVVVRINDRGPYIASRIIDLSYAAARGLGMTPPGLGAVAGAGRDPELSGLQRVLAVRRASRRLPRPGERQPHTRSDAAEMRRGADRAVTS